jgi:hypothetical protein
MDLKQREYHCDLCGITQHRHTNAAINIRNWVHQPWTIDHAGQDLPPAPVDVITDILYNWGLLSVTTIKQPAVGVHTNSSSWNPMLGQANTWKTHEKIIGFVDPKNWLTDFRLVLY